jgi:hypothetical protein
LEGVSGDEHLLACTELDLIEGIAIGGDDGIEVSESVCVLRCMVWKEIGKLLYFELVLPSYVS